MLLQHVLAQLLMPGAGTWAASAVFSLPWRAALLMALAVFTPSTGFILDSLDTLGLSPDERFWVRSKAIASELVALGVLAAGRPGHVRPLRYGASRGRARRRGHGRRRGA